MTAQGVQNSQLMDSSYKLGGGGLCSSSEDLARFAGALMAGELVEEETLALMWTSQRTKDGEETGYGMGFSVGELDGELTVGHSGAQARVSTMLQLLPSRKVGVVVLCNLEQVKLKGVALRALRRVRAEVGE
jgi:CubicO group peptidase (beta-lactamase class C family)